MLAGESDAIIAVTLCITCFETEILQVEFPWEEIRLHGFITSAAGAPARAHHHIYKTTKCFCIEYINIF